MSTKIALSKLCTCLILACLFMPNYSLAETRVDTSTALDTLFRQTEDTYLRALGVSKQEALNQAPEVFANLVGLTLQQQLKQLDEYKNHKYLSRYEALQDEALSFMGELARAHNYRHPIDGSDMSEYRLKAAFYNGVKQDASNMRFGNTNPADVRLPFILSQVELPVSSGGGEHGKLQVKPTNEIDFLGQVSPPAEYSYEEGTPLNRPQNPNDSTSALPLTGCSSAKITIKRDVSTMSVSMGQYNEVFVHFSKSATITAAIEKIFMTYSTRLGSAKREMRTEGGSHSTWRDYLNLSGYSPKKHGPLRLTFEAYNDREEIICEGETQK